MAQRIRTLMQEQDGEPSGGLFGYLKRRRGRKALKRQVTKDMVNKLGETETMLDELQPELRYLREHRQEQEDSISQLKNEIVALYSKRPNSVDDLDLLQETLRLSNEENLQLRESESRNKAKIEEMYNQLKLNQENIEYMTKIVKKSEVRVENLESELQKFKEKVKDLQRVKEYLAKNSAEKEYEMKQMKALHKKDRDAFEKVQEFNLQKFDQLQKKYENVLRHLWEKCNKCRNCRTNIQNRSTNVNEFSTPQEISLRMLKLRQDNKYSDGISITNEPNITLLNTTFTMIENELYRYKIMNDLLEDRITEYEPEYSMSSDSVKVESYFSALSDQSLQEDTSNIFEIISDDSIGQPTTLNSSLDIYERVSSIGLNESKAESSGFGEFLDGAINDLSKLFKHTTE